MTQSISASTLNVQTIVIGKWTITAKDDGLYVTGGGHNLKVELIDLSKGPIPPAAE